jgi:hypothetical protein
MTTRGRGNPPPHPIDFDLRLNQLRQPARLNSHCTGQARM